MSGRGEYGAGRSHGVQSSGTRRLRGAAALLLSAATGLGLATFSGKLTGNPFTARAQELTGAAIAVDRAGSGTGDTVAAFDSSSAGMRDTGHAASPLPVVADDHAPFDMAGERRRVGPAPGAALAMHAEPAPFALQADVPAEPAVGRGAPETGTGTATPGAASGNAATPATPAPAAATPGAAHPTAASVPDAAAPGATVPARLTEMIGNQLIRFTPNVGEQQALAAFYGARGYQPVFTGGKGIAPLGQIALDQFAASAVEGLNPADYLVPALPASPSDTQLAEMELRLAATTLLYARHVQSGRFDPKIISKDVDPNPTVPDPAAVLATVSTAPNARAAFESFAPQYDEYRLLKTQLARLMTEGQAVSHAAIPPGPSLRPGDNDPRVPLLRARLGIGGAPEDSVYDPMLVDAVREFQRLSGQSADGIVGRGTLAALNAGASGDRLHDIVANMERWRWVPHDVAPVYVMVNIPEYMVRIVVNEQAVHETRVVVGKPENQTPIMSENMQYAVFNPSWNVPPGIIRNEMLPKLMADPYALERQGIDVVRNGRIIDPGSVNWSRGAQGYSFRQAPGERNALGRMKFMFPNKHAVYLHDTPSRSLFSRDRRAFSHGCVRVHEPLAFAEALFAVGSPGEGWSQQRLSRLVGGNEKSLPLKQRFPVHLVYFTTYVDGTGQLVTREDIYGTNAATKAILGLDGTRRVADRGAAVRPR
ncbi:L,D-transpeptidase family protein [Starkeya sp. 3C]|uniref:L,D-transpeptidase family protein n=1 Tax=Ancylobacter moscoviensis TaxID=2597768 RepID=A0ABY3DMR1_9HYPH|nr:L,D-transpeptidase family protein [Ancylobacter moscoviensis]TSJ60398.1 L,D-transpeptidase family protein [Ancylobacter moscoviensis]